ncbi:TetR/AcrR family transcriptional regulator [Thalassolituus sp. LLYu03]|uniref:TetR/AcrR family transcriptional regulator n=1 Tax=Thalassolituus sp. LLYu03 TaxID=3421656 RepID=UPI003D296B4D
MTETNTLPAPPANTANGRLYGGQTQEERRLARREAFLQAGLEVFGQDGFRTATVRGICRQAQLTDRYFYAEFGTLELLLQAVYSHCMDNLYQRLGAVFRNAGAGADMNALTCEALTLFFEVLEDKRIARVCMLELEGVSEDTNAHYLNYIRRFALLLMAVARGIHPHWRIADDEAEMLGMGLVGAMRQMSVNWLLSGHAANRETLVRSGQRLIMGLVLQLQQDYPAT